MSVTTHNLARNYFRRLGKSTSSSECDTLGSCIAQLQVLGVMGSIQEMWIHRSTYNAGSGSTSFGVFGRANMTLVGSPVWGVNGLTFDGTTQYGTATLPVGITSGSMVTVSQGDSAGQVAFATVGSIVAAAGRAAAGGGHIGTITTWSGSAITTFAYNGSVATDGLPVTPAYGSTEKGFRMFAFATDSAGPTMLNWSDWNKATHVSPVAHTNLSSIVTNAASFDNPGYSLFYKGTIAVSLVFNAALPDATVQAIYAILRKTVASGLPWTQTVMIEGDSQATGTALVLDADRWHTKLIVTPSASGWYGTSFRNIQAIGGTWSFQRLAAYDTVILPQKPRAFDDKPWFFLIVGINDFSGSEVAPVVLSNVLAHHALARRDGFRTVAFTLPACNNLTASQEVERRTFNDRLKANSRAYDYLVDWGTVFKTWDAANFLDGVHLGAVGSTVGTAAIQSAIPSPF